MRHSTSDFTVGVLCLIIDILLWLCYIFSKINRNLTWTSYLWRELFSYRPLSFELCRKELFNIQNVILPPRLEKGDTIGIFNSSYPITAESPDAAKRAVEFLQSKGYIIKHGKLWGCIDSYRTASAKERADEFNELLYDSSVKCIMASIGGFVTNSMLPYIDYDCFMQNPKL